ncbi:MAG: hypothetical protein HOC23_08665 [Halieaceae bacterium]|jgi:hypothetical protein|nr:hypothetical protein [Halieaceae bacterium]
MKLHQLTSMFFLCAMSCSLFAEDTVISDDGREVQLKDDGSWIYKSTDRFATTADGKRVRLKDDGSWIFTGEKAIVIDRGVVADKKFIETLSLEVTLTELAIETYRGRRSESHKSSRKKTQSVFSLSFAVDKSAPEPLILALEENHFSVEDSDGREYPIVRVEPLEMTIKPGAQATVIVRSDGSPHWWTTKSMRLILDKQALASRDDIQLLHSMSSAKKRAVDGFD